MESIEHAVEQLSPTELAKFRHWLAQFDADAWEARIEADVAAGKLDTLAGEALAEYRSGQARSAVIGFIGTVIFPLAL